MTILARLFGTKLDICPKCLQPYERPRNVHEDGRDFEGCPNTVTVPGVPGNPTRECGYKFPRWQGVKPARGTRIAVIGSKQSGKTHFMAALTRASETDPFFTKNSMSIKADDNCRDDYDTNYRGQLDKHLNIPTTTKGTEHSALARVLDLWVKETGSDHAMLPNPYLLSMRDVPGGNYTLKKESGEALYVESCAAILYMIDIRVFLNPFLPRPADAPFLYCANDRQFGEITDVNPVDRLDAYCSNDRSCSKKHLAICFTKSDILRDALSERDERGRLVFQDKPHSLSRHSMLFSSFPFYEKTLEAETGLFRRKLRAQAEEFMDHWVDQFSPLRRAARAFGSHRFFFISATGCSPVLYSDLLPQSKFPGLTPTRMLDPVIWTMNQLSQGGRGGWWDSSDD